MERETQEFILFWGKMGSRWGVNRATAQTHAILLTSPIALNAQEISENLNIARSNISTSIKELLKWGLIESHQKIGERSEYYQAKNDVWEMFQSIARERKKMELDPLRKEVKKLKEGFKKSNAKTKQQKHFQEKIEDIDNFLSLAFAFYDLLNGLPLNVVKRFLKQKKLIETLILKSK